MLDEGIPPSEIQFFTGELIDDHHLLIDILSEQTKDKLHADNRQYIIIDEVTYIKNWDKGIKFAADAGMLENCIVVLTGSDLTMMQAARMTFPGRRGRADQVDFHIYSLSFSEFMLLKKPIENIDEICHTDIFPDDNPMRCIFENFSDHQKHGGYLTAINDIARDGKVAKATLKTYSDWIRGDVLKRDKQEIYLKEILDAIIKRYNKQVTWHSITDAISIDSHKTVADYCELLSIMDA